MPSKESILINSGLTNSGELGDAKEFSLTPNLDGAESLLFSGRPCTGAPCNPGPGGPPPKCAPRPPREEA